MIITLNFFHLIFIIIQSTWSHRFSYDYLTHWFTLKNPPSYFIVKINQNNGNPLNIAEVEFYYLNNKLSSSLFTFTGSSNYDGLSSPVNANDNNYNSYFHSNSGGDQTLVIFTDVRNSFDKIVVTSRTDCCQDRLVDAYINIYNGTDLNSLTLFAQPFWTRKFTSSSQSHTFSIFLGPSSQPSIQPLSKPSKQPSCQPSQPSSQPSISKDVTVSYYFTGSKQIFNIPDDVSIIDIEISGGSGGTDYSGGYGPTAIGGKGGVVKTKLIVSNYTVLIIYVGGAGFDRTTPSGVFILAPGGFNGGGSGLGRTGAGGGGATDIRFNDSISTRFVVAGAGG